MNSALDAEAGSTRPQAAWKDAQRPPGITVVVTSRHDARLLLHFLEKFSPCLSEAEAELIVVRAGSPSELAAISQQFPTPTYLAADLTTGENDLRRIGFARSSRDLILFLEDGASERHDWAATLCRNWRAWIDAPNRVASRAGCGAEQAAPYPYLSVVMPVRNGGPPFLVALESMALSDFPRQSWELVIVDDASTDDTAFVAAQYADRLLRLRHGPHGPGYARNRGFELTMGECVAFIDADVMVHTDTLTKSAAVLMQQADVGAVFGSCDASPMAKGLLSQYQSTVRRYYHHRDADNAFTFSSACGIVRSSVFERAGGYDEWHFSRRQLEDLELGHRIRSLGERIVSHPDIRATHLKRWTLRRMVATEIFDRSVPWMRLVRRQLRRDRDDRDSARRIKNVNITLSWLGAICAALAWRVQSPVALLVAAGCIAVVLVNNAPELAFFSRERGVLFAAVSFPLDVLYYLVSGIGIVFGWIARQAVGEPTPGAVVEAFTEMGVKRWPPVPVKRVGRSSAASVVADAAVADHATVDHSADPIDLPVLPEQASAQDPPGDSLQSLQ